MIIIISENNKPSFSQFQELMKNADELQNQDANLRESYYIGRGGRLLETDVYNAIVKAAKYTPFEDTIQLISGASFPDIIANKFYGVEVKSTEKNHWTSIGSSILESTRDINVERIFLTFGKLGKPIEFKSRPYEECLSGIVVTHYPRYQVDMRLKQGETIFDKMGVTYDDLCAMDNPVKPVSKYYKNSLKEGESLWWSENNTEAEAPAKIRLWTTLSPESKLEYTSQGYALFPEILSVSSNKYNRFSLWLVVEKGIVNTNIRDSFSAGGKIPMKLSSGIELLFPAAFGKIRYFRNIIIDTILNESETSLKDYWKVKEISGNRVAQWCEMVAFAVEHTVVYSDAIDILRSIFF